MCSLSERNARKNTFNELEPKRDALVGETAAPQGSKQRVAALARRRGRPNV